MDNIIVQHELGKGFELGTPITLPKHYITFTTLWRLQELSSQV